MFRFIKIVVLRCRLVLMMITLSYSSLLFSANTLIVLGDSLSANYGIEPNQGWVPLLKERLKKEGYSEQVINASTSGDTTSNGLIKLPGLLKQYKPNILILELGANDGLRGLSLPQAKQNLEEMIQMAQKAQIKVLLIGMRIPLNYGPLYNENFYQIYADLAKKYSVAFLPFLLEHVARDSDLFQFDGIHPTSEAQPIILDTVWPYLKPLLGEPDAQPVK